MKLQLTLSLFLGLAFLSFVSSQTYYASDSLALLEIDIACDSLDSLNWNTEADPGKWEGVVWSLISPKRVKEIDIREKNLADTLIINNLDSLFIINCISNQLDELHASKLPVLRHIICSENKLKKIELTELDNLWTLFCYQNALQSLNISQIKSIKGLRCGTNKITELDVKGLINLQALECDHNQLTSLDVTSNLNLYYFDCSNNQITPLNISGLSVLNQLFCGGNQISNLDLSSASNLFILMCDVNKLKSLDVSNTILSMLYCGVNQITDLDVSMLSELGLFKCHLNNLPFSSLATALDLKLLNADNFKYAPQDTIFTPDTVELSSEINYSDESIINGTFTKFIYFFNGEKVDSNSTGIFTPSTTGVFHCEMTNLQFPDLTLVTAPVTIVPQNSVESPSNASFKVFPNPVDDILHTYLPEPNVRSSISIYNSAGIRLLHFDSDKPNFDLNLTQLLPGNYILRIVTPDNDYSKQISVQ